MATEILERTLGSLESFSAASPSTTSTDRRQQSLESHAVSGQTVFATHCFAIIAETGELAADDEDPGFAGRDFQSRIRS